MELQKLQDRVKQEPLNPKHHYQLAITAYHAGNIQLAENELRETLKLDPRHTEASICLSIIYNDTGRYDDARQIFDQAHTFVAQRESESTTIDMKFALKHLEIADLYARYRRFDEAIEEYSKAAHLDPKNIEILMRRAKAYAKKGFLTRALSELNHIRSLHPTFLPARIQIGLLHYSQGNILDAEIEWEQAANIAPAHQEIEAYLAMARRARSEKDPSLTETMPY